MLLTATERLTMNTRPKNPANARNLNFCGIGSSGSGKTRFWLTPQLLQAHSSYVVVDPKGGVLGQVGSFLQKRGYGHFTDTVYMPVCRCKIDPFLAAVTTCRTVKISINTRIGLVKDADKVILHSRLVLHVKAKLTVHGFELIA